MSNGKIRNGQLLNTSFIEEVVPFTEQMCDIATANSKVNDPATEIIPHDEASAIVRVYNTAAVLALVADIFQEFPGKVDLALPPVLKSVAVTFSKSHGNGASSHPTSQQSTAFSGSGSVALRPTSTAQGSAAITPGIAEEIEEVWAHNVPTRNFLIYLGDTTTATITAKINQFISPATALTWPVFRPVAHTFTLTGQQLSLSQSADSSAEGQANASGTSGNALWGSGSSQEVGVSIVTKRLPPTIHGALTITGTTDTDSVTVDVAANTLALSGSSGGFSFSIGAITNDPAPVTGNVTGTVTPSSLAATSPAAIPTTGLYIFDTRIQGNYYGVNEVLVTLIDFSFFA